MGTIEIVSASAGSGKTYRLAELLEEAVASGRVRPDAIVATTFTVKAAAELKERVRTRLLAAGRLDDAQRLAASRIGTVNAVCGRLVSDFAFELGLSPDLAVLDERLARQMLERSITDHVSADETAELAGLAARLVGTDWEAAVAKIVDFARSNAMDAPALAACADRSLEEMGALFGPASRDGAALDAALASALARFLDGVDPGHDATKVTKEALVTAGQSLRQLRAGERLPHSVWLKLQDLAVGAKSREAVAGVHEAAAAHDFHPDLRRDLDRHVRLVFSIAARALAAYEAYKRDWGAIDFVDQEVLALRLLSSPEIISRVAGEIDLVLVDEFQDTSPLQLAIFLALSAVAPRSVWVGDQKQAIYGFRGTDPALMDAALDVLLRGAEPETLRKSWRSRPELVRLTSDLFAPAFASHGIPAARVRLEPARDEEPEGLGPVVERWRSETKKQDDDAAALACGLAELLEDPNARVRDRATGEPRAPRPGDVAVLCRTNDACARVAAAIARVGLRAARPRDGLLATPEARLVAAGLRLWVDPRDALAAAEIARMVAFPEDADAWLAAVLAKPGFDAFAAVPEVARVRARREREPTAGALPALDAVIDALGAVEYALAWGDGAARAANLDALRAHGASYVSESAAAGAACTPAGLACYLDELGRAGDDERATATDDQSIVVSTWHGAKGLEWPITVLDGLDPPRVGGALGVQVVSDGTPFDLARPLASRFLRYWPTPYHPMQIKAPFHVRLGTHPATAAAERREYRQSLRLLYVGWTRARDRLVLSGRKGALSEGMLDLLAGPTGPLVSEPDGPDTTWGGYTFHIRIRETAPRSPVPRERAAVTALDARGPAAHPPAYLAPSSTVASGAALRHESIGSRLTLAEGVDMAALGSAVHRFFAADRPHLTGADRLRIAAALLQRWDVAGALAPEAIVAASSALTAHVERRWPGATWHREWPVARRLPGGTLVRGAADLVLELPAGFVVVDHKSFPGNVDQALARAAAYAGQLAAYAEAIRVATSRPILGCFIHLPVSGLVVEVDAAPAGVT